MHVNKYYFGLNHNTERPSIPTPVPFVRVMRCIYDKNEMHAHLFNSTRVSYRKVSTDYGTAELFTNVKLVMSAESRALLLSVKSRVRLNPFT